MKYIEFCYHEQSTSSLTKLEIENPFLVLDELCKKRSCEDFQNELHLLIQLLTTNKEWVNHNPATIYRTYKDLKRLIDTLYLLNKYSPELSTVIIDQNQPVKEVNTTDFMYRFNKVFLRIPSTLPIIESIDQASGHNSVLSIQYNTYNYNLNLIRFSLYNYLKIGLDASYMGVDKYDHFSIEDNNIAADSISLNILIKEAYQIHKKSPMAFPKINEYAETKFSIDNDHTTQLSAECIANPSEIIHLSFKYYLNVFQIKQALSIWNEMLYKKDIWKESSNPGNILYFHESLEAIIDAIWLKIQTGDLETDIKKYNPKKQGLISIWSLNKEEYKNPLLVINSFFEHKRLHEWKMQLQTWTEYSLSNTEALKIRHRNKTLTDFNLLLKFIETVHLLNISSQPILN